MKAFWFTLSKQGTRDVESRIPAPRFYPRVLWHRPTAPRLALGLLVTCLAQVETRAQDTNDVESLKRQLHELQENFEKTQREQARQIDALTRKLDELTKQQAQEAEKKKLEQELATQLSSN